MGANYVDLLGNHLWHDPYAPTTNWATSTFFRIGQAAIQTCQAICAYPCSTTPVFIALTAGRTGSSEPNWASVSVDGTVVDGGITWRWPKNFWNYGNCAYSVNNHWESKSVTNAKINNNFDDRL